MSRAFNFTPHSIPAMPQNGALNPCFLLERPQNAVGAIAARTLWLLWNEFGTSGAPLRVPLSTLSDEDPRGAYASRQRFSLRDEFQVDMRAGHAVFPDLSAFVFQKCIDGQPGDIDGETYISILPVAFLLHPSFGPFNGPPPLSLIQTKNGVSLGCGDDPDGKKLRTVERQLDLEASAWARMIPHSIIKGEAEPIAGNEDYWPSFFPRDTLRPQQDVDTFMAHVQERLASILAWSPETLHAVHVSAWSAVPLQGGCAPIRLAMDWILKIDNNPQYANLLHQHAESLIFSPDGPWRQDDFVGVKVATNDLHQYYPLPVELFSIVVNHPASNHQALRLIKKYSTPPDVPLTHLNLIQSAKDQSSGAHP